MSGMYIVSVRLIETVNLLGIDDRIIKSIS